MVAALVLLTGCCWCLLRVADRVVFKFAFGCDCVVDDRIDVVICFAGAVVGVAIADAVVVIVVLLLL